MSTTPSKRIGRPRKSAMEKGGQFSIRLPLQRKLELEVIARSRGESLSQAVERAIEIASKVIEVHTEDGKSVQDVVGIGMSASAGFFRDNMGYPFAFDALSKLIEKNPASYRAFVLPDSLREPGEKFFHRIVDLISSDSDNDTVIAEMADNGELDLVLQSCGHAVSFAIDFEQFMKSAKAEDAVDLAREWIRKGTLTPK